MKIIVTTIRLEQKAILLNFNKFKNKSLTLLVKLLEYKYNDMKLIKNRKWFKIITKFLLSILPIRILSSSNRIDDSKILTIQKFEDFEFERNLLRGIYNQGFENPLELEKSAILPIINGRDFICQSQPGLGKTTSFIIGTIKLNDINKNYIQAVIITYSNLLVKETAHRFQDIGSYLGLKVYNADFASKDLLNINNNHNLVQSSETYLLNLNNNHIIVGTSRTLEHMITKKIINIDKVIILVLDEVDKLLSFTNLERIKNIVNVAPLYFQIATFSTTISEEDIKLLENFLSNPIKMLLKRKELIFDGIVSI